jgi:threonine/homoserine/homoserine lactone efflux protein
MRWPRGPATAQNVQVPSFSHFAVFVPAALALLLIPGPAVLYVVTRSVQQGRRAGLLSVAGLHTGTLLHIGAAAVGLSALLARSAVIFSIVKYAGAAYLVLLGVTTLRRGDASEPVAEPRRSNRRVFAQGFVVEVLNPKVALFFVAFLPQFVDPSRGHIAMQIVAFGVTYLALGLVTDSLYALVGSQLAGRMRASRKARRRQRFATGAILIGLGGVAAAAK